MGPQHLDKELTGSEGLSSRTPWCLLVGLGALTRHERSKIAVWHVWRSCVSWLPVLRRDADAFHAWETRQMASGNEKACLACAFGLRRSLTEKA